MKSNISRANRLNRDSLKFRALCCSTMQQCLTKPRVLVVPIHPFYFLKKKKKINFKIF
jgi:hypothetical protein